MKKYLKKSDMVLGLVLVIVCVLMSLAAYRSGESGIMVRISVEGKTYGTYSLQENRVVEIDTERGHNQLTIKDGKAFMSEADCPDQYCMSQHRNKGGMSNTNETLICLPHKVIVSIEGTSGNEPDVIVGRTGGSKDKETDGGETS